MEFMDLGVQQEPNKVLVLVLVLLIGMGESSKVPAFVAFHLNGGDR